MSFGDFFNKYFNLNVNLGNGQDSPSVQFNAGSESSYGYMPNSLYAMDMPFMGPCGNEFGIFGGCHHRHSSTAENVAMGLFGLAGGISAANAINNGDSASFSMSYSDGYGYGPGLYYGPMGHFYGDYGNLGPFSGYYHGDELSHEFRRFNRESNMYTDYALERTDDAFGRAMTDAERVMPGFMTPKAENLVMPGFPKQILPPGSKAGNTTTGNAAGSNGTTAATGTNGTEAKKEPITYGTPRREGEIVKTDDDGTTIKIYKETRDGKEYQVRQFADAEQNIVDQYYIKNGDDYSFVRQDIVTEITKGQTDGKIVETHNSTIYDKDKDGKVTGYHAGPAIEYNSIENGQLTKITPIQNDSPAPKKPQNNGQGGQGAQGNKQVQKTPLEQLNDKMGKRQGEKDALDNAYNNINNKYGWYQSKSESDKAALKFLDAQRIAAQNDINGYKTQIDTLNNNNTGLQDKINSNNGTIETNKAEIEKDKALLSGNAETKKWAQDRIKYLNGENARLQGEVNNWQKQIKEGKAPENKNINYTIEPSMFY